MRLGSISVGRPKDRVLMELHDAYARRIVRMGVRYEPSFVREEAVLSLRAVDQALRRQAKSLAEALDGWSKVVALDVRGELVTSERLASRLGRWGGTAVGFVVGGPHGLPAPILEAADWRWSLSPLTFPHELVRVLLAEQVYRALTLLRGLPYHKA